MQVPRTSGVQVPRTSGVQVPQKFGVQAKALNCTTGGFLGFVLRLTYDNGRFFDTLGASPAEGTEKAPPNLTGGASAAGWVDTAASTV